MTLTVHCGQAHPTDLEVRCVRPVGHAGQHKALMALWWSG